MATREQEWFAEMLAETYESVRVKEQEGFAILDAGALDEEGVFTPAGLSFTLNPDGDVVEWTAELGP